LRVSINRRTTLCMRRQSHLIISIVIAVAIVQTGCYTTSERASYRLTEPTAPLVRELVEVGDQLEVRLKDLSVQRIQVAAVTESSIKGRNGATIEIDSIVEMTCTETEYEMTGSTEAFLGGAAQGAAPLIGTVWLPVYWGTKLFGGSLPPVREWEDIQLCRVTNRREDYQSRPELVWHDTEEQPTLDEISREVQRRRLNCDPSTLAERHCAGVTTHGPTFSDCAMLVEPIERLGPAGVGEWDDQSLCEVSAKLVVLGLGSKLPGSKTLRQVITWELIQRDLDCGSLGIKSPTILGAELAYAGYEIRNGQLFEIGDDQPYTGSHEILHDNGVIAGEIFFRDGFKHGIHTFYDRDGNKEVQKSYQKGELHGSMIIWYKNGHKSSETIYATDKRHGLMTWWERDGDIDVQYCYKHGDLVALSPEECHH